MMFRNSDVKTFSHTSTVSQRDIIPSKIKESDLQDTNTYYTTYTTINFALKDLRIGTLLSFVGINLRFVTGNIINALIFFKILQSGNPNLRYDIHAPSIPDMCGDMVMVVIFAIAYLFITSTSVKNINLAIGNNLYKLNGQHLEAIRHIENYIHRSKGFFSLTVIGASLYLFTRYVLSIGLEIVFIENTTFISFVLNMLNDMIRLCSPVIFVYVYCKYLSVNKPIACMLYLFFIIRNLFATNVLGLITYYDLHVGAPFLDVITPLIIIYSVISIIFGVRQNQVFVKSLGQILTPLRYLPFQPRFQRSV